jgi:hypothetical protein
MLLTVNGARVMQSFDISWYVSIVVSGVFYLPLSIMIYCYTHIFRIARTQTFSVNRNNGGTDNRIANIQKTENKHVILRNVADSEWCKGDAIV